MGLDIESINVAAMSIGFTLMMIAAAILFIIIGAKIISGGII